MQAYVRLLVQLEAIHHLFLKKNINPQEMEKQIEEAKTDFERFLTKATEILEITKTENSISEEEVQKFKDSI